MLETVKDGHEPTKEEYIAAMDWPQIHSRAKKRALKYVPALLIALIAIHFVPFLNLNLTGATVIVATGIIGALAYYFIADVIRTYNYMKLYEK